MDGGPDGRIGGSTPSADTHGSARRGTALRGRARQGREVPDVSDRELD